MVCQLMSVVTDVMPLDCNHLDVYMADVFATVADGIAIVADGIATFVMTDVIVIMEMETIL